MNNKPFLTIIIGIAILGSIATGARQASDNTPNPTSTPAYTADGQLRLPVNYRRWIYVTTGFDMSYTASQTPDHHMFDNVFVNPDSYSAFLKTGAWPDKTLLVLEVRGAKSKGSINQSGNFQDSDVMGLEVHVKDVSRFKNQGDWAFFGFDSSSSTSKMTPTSASCYSCHAQHAAVDTTFVQFYPTLFPTAQSHSTLSPSYLHDPTTPAN